MTKTFVGAAILILAWPATSHAQILRIGPLGGVSVRVPFVSVDVSPWGGTRVRAPFTSINTPDRYYGMPGGYSVPGGYSLPPHGQMVPRHSDFHGEWHAAPPIAAPWGEPPLGPETSYREPYQELYRPPAPRYHIPSYAEVFPESAGAPVETEDRRSAADPTRLAERLGEGAGRLTQTLEARDDGDVWNDYLRCEAIGNLAAELVASRSVEPISAPEVRSLLANFDGVAANPSLEWVTRLSGFGETRQALADLTALLEEDESAASGIINIDPSEWRGDDIVPPVEGEELPAPAPDPRPGPDPVPDAGPQPVFRGEV